MTDAIEVIIDRSFSIDKYHFHVLHHPPTKFSLIILQYHRLQGIRLIARKTNETAAESSILVPPTQQWSLCKLEAKSRRENTPQNHRSLLKQSIIINSTAAVFKNKHLTDTRYSRTAFIIQCMTMNRNRFGVYSLKMRIHTGGKCVGYKKNLSAGNFSRGKLTGENFFDDSPCFRSITVVTRIERMIPREKKMHQARPLRRGRVSLHFRGKNRGKRG